MIGIRGTRLALAAVLAATVLGGSAGVAAAQTAPSVVTGKITKITSTELSVKTTTKVVTGKLSTIAVITKSAKSTLSAVSKGTFVNVTLSSNGKTVTGINVGNRGSGSFPRGSFPRTGRTPRTPRLGTRPPGGFRRGLFHGGQVVSVSRSKIQLKSFQGKTTTYAVSSHVTVTKTVQGKRSDLHVGETVRIIPIRADNSMFSLTIVSG